MGTGNTAARAYTWLGLGVGVIGVAFTLRPVEIPAIAFGALLLIGLAMVVAGLIGLYRHLARRHGTPDPCPFEQSRLLASECRRVENALDGHYKDHLQRRPKGFFGDEARLQRWADEFGIRYRKELREWIVGVFDNAVQCKALASSSRPLVEAPSMSQLPLVQGLFREAAEMLEET
jgi:hypothetical protein